MIKNMMDGSICFVAGKKKLKVLNSKVQSSSCETMEYEERKVIPDEPVKIYKIKVGRRKNHYPSKLKEIPIPSSTFETKSKIIKSCPVCPYTTSCSNRFEKHLKLHPTTNLKSSCEMDWEQSTDVKSSASFQMPLQINENVMRNFSNTRKCFKVEKSNDLSTSFFSHLDSATKSISLNEFLDTSKENLETRKKSKGRGVIKNQSKPSKQFQGENYPSEASLLSNVSGDSLSHTYRCSFCNFASSRKDHFRAHSQSHRNDKFTCKKCYFSTNSEDKLDEHMQSHFSKRSYTCPDCRFLTLSREDYKEHMKSCCSKFYECPDCDYISVRKDHMKRHLRTHDKYIDYSSIIPTINPAIELTSHS